MKNYLIVCVVLAISELAVAPSHAAMTPLKANASIAQIHAVQIFVTL